ncbi:MAG: CoA pyrophosphatase [Thalassotalea sp.]
MKKATFLTQFLFNNKLLPVAKPNSPLINAKTLMHAAVLIPIIENNNQLEVILTKRASHLKHHGGQISFPGGKVEKSDRNNIATALRETHEEIGIASENITIVGTLPEHYTLTGFHITPVLAFIEPQSQYQLDKNEVAEVFHVPLSHFLNTQNHIALSIYHNLSSHPVYFIPYKHYNIWGATASILKKLAEQLQH